MTPEEQFAAASVGIPDYDPDAIFPRTKERDPYRRLGISDESTFEEVQDARNYLVETYRAHVAGVEAIEQAFDKIINDRLSTRKKAKGMKKALRKQKKGENYVPPFMERLKAQFEKPDQTTIMRRALMYAIMMGWAIVSAGNAPSGPAFQMAISFGLCVYFLHDKRGGAAAGAPLGKSFINGARASAFSSSLQLLFSSLLFDRRRAMRPPRHHSRLTNQIVSLPPSSLRRVVARVRRRVAVPVVHSDLPSRVGAGADPLAVLHGVVLHLRDVLEVIEVRGGREEGAERGRERAGRSRRGATRRRERIFYSDEPHKYYSSLHSY